MTTRIAEIKARLEKAERGDIVSYRFDFNAYGDTAYLLSLVEQMSEALQDCAEELQTATSKGAQEARAEALTLLKQIEAEREVKA